MDVPIHVRLPAEYELRQLDQLLAGKFVFTLEPLASEKWRFYDTFDWRLFNRSLLLRHAGQGIFLEQLSGGESLKGLSDGSAPEFVWDLPASSLRVRLEPIIKMRALLPLAEVHTRSRTYRILNADEKTIARIVYTEARTADVESGSLLAAYLSLRPVRGYPRHARKLSERLVRAGQLTSMLEDIYLRALDQAGQKPGSYSRKLDVRLRPQSRADVSTKVILRHLLEIMKANEAGIKADIDTEYLHDYRIAIRRTRSALREMSNVFPAEVTKHFKQEFRTLGQLTNDLRDLDVYLLSEDDFEARLPDSMRQDIVPLFDYLRLRRGQAFEEVSDALSSSKYARALGEWEEFLGEPVSKKTIGANGAMPIVDLARKRIYKRYRRVIKAGDYILRNTQDDDRLHALRIECKRLRYLLEFFTSLFPRKKITRLIRHLKKLQDNLGAFNDLSVQQEYLMHMALELPLDDTRSRRILIATGHMVEKLGYEQTAVRADFAKAFKEFASPANQALFRELFATKGKQGEKAGR